MNNIPMTYEDHLVRLAERVKRLEDIIDALVGDGDNGDEAAFKALALNSPVTDVMYDPNERLHGYGPRGAWTVTCWCDKWRYVSATVEDAEQQARAHVQYTHSRIVEFYPELIVGMSPRDEPSEAEGRGAAA